MQLTTQKCGIYRQIVTNIRQIVANIVQKVTIIVQKVIKIVQLHLLLPAFKPVILITAPHVGRGGFERIRAEYVIKRHYVAESARHVSGGGGGGARARNVPQNEVQTNYVPHVPHLRYS